MDRTQRVAGFGWNLQDERVHCVPHLDSAETLVGFDLIVWDVETTVPGSQLDRTGPFYRRDVARRREEIEQHLAAGRPLIMFLPSANWHVSGARVPGDFLPFALELVGARGTHMEIVDPLVAPLFDWERTAVASQFEAYMPDPPGRPLLRIARSDRVVGTLAQASAAPVATARRSSGWRPRRSRRSAST
jgi:hypothetical protein